MGSRDTREKTIKSTQTAFDIIETIAAKDQPNISEIASEIGYSRSTTHYHLKTLQRERYVIRDDEGFSLGLCMARLGKLALEQHPLIGIVEKTTDELAADADAVAQVAIREGNKIVWLYRSSIGDLEELQTGVGTETSMHYTAYGQAILAALSSETVEELVEAHGLPQSTDKTLTEAEELHDRLSMVQKLGFAYSAEEYIPGVSSIAAPIVDESIDEVIGSVGITDRHRRINDPYKHPKARRFSDELPGMIQRAAQIIENKVAE